MRAQQHVRCSRGTQPVAGNKSPFPLLESQPTSRRSLLNAATLSALVLLSKQSPAQAAPVTSQVLVPGSLTKPLRPPWGPGPEPPEWEPLRAFWQQLLAELQPQLSGEFSPSLVFYAKGADLPSGVPGDPARDYSSRAKEGLCGTYREGSLQPYSICPAPGAAPADDNIRACCRHMAYAVPRSRFALAALDRHEAVVLSPRTALLPESNWKAILVHEMGHCVDFWVFGRRYLLSDHRPRDPAAHKLLAAIDSQVSDVEERGDLMASSLLSPQLLARRHLCYSGVTSLQELVGQEVVCDGSGQPGDARPALHFPHPPLQGKNLAQRVATLLSGSSRSSSSA